MNCRSSSSSCRSPSQLSSPRILDIGLLENIRNVSPRLSSLSSPIVQLERRLPDQASLGWNYERAVLCNSTKSTPFNSTPTQKSAAELRKEIGTLEIEIMHMERCLLSLYRTAFEEHLPSLSNVARTEFQYMAALPSPIMANRLCYKLDPHMQKGDFSCQAQVSHTDNVAISDSQNFSASLKATSTRERRRSDSGHRSLADYLCASHIVDNFETPDRLSEEIVQCISSIYCKLANSSQSRASLSASSPSSFSSSSIFSSKNHCDSWSPRCSEGGTVNQQLKESKEEGGAHAAMREVLDLCLDDDSFKYAAVMLQKFRSLVRSLEKVDPRKMKREEKLAFWINIHNALVMHAYLAYGTHNRVRSNSILKAAYNVGGHCVNAYDIQCSILGIRPRQSLPWLQTLFSPGRKIKTARHAYALEYPEPLVHFALCLGAYSDPVVRVYTATSIFQDLRFAKQEFIRASVFIYKGTKIFSPKIMYDFAKDMSLDMPGLLEVIMQCQSEVQKKAMKKCMKGRHDKCIYWLPQSSNFRYVIHEEVVKARPSI